MSKYTSAPSRIFILFLVASFTSVANAGTYVPVSQVSGGNYYQRVVGRDGNVYSTGMSPSSGIPNDSYNPFWFKHVSDGDMYPQSAYLAHIIAVESGSYWGLALDANNFCWSWGSNNGFGTLGNGEPSSTKPEPVRVVGGDMNTQYLQHVIAISASKSGFFSLAVDSNNNTYGWGYNHYYQLGRIGSDYYTSPILINGLPKIKSVATGLQTSYAVDVNGFLWSFGSNQSGALGINSTNQNLNQYRPQEVNEITGQGRLHHIKAAASGWSHCLALEDMNNPNDPNVSGRVFAFGYDYYGQLGDNSTGGTSNNRCYPVLVQAGEQNPINPGLPLKNIIAVACGQYHSVFLDSAGNVYCVGSSNNGQTGNASFSNTSLPVRVKGYKGKDYLNNIVAISASQTGSFAVDANGMLWAWGVGSYDLLGCVDYMRRPTPDPVPLYASDSRTDIWNDTQDCNYTTIQNAVSAAHPNDVIVLGKGIYLGPVDLGSKNLTITCTNPNDDITVAHTIISGQYTVESIACTNNNSSIIRGLHLAPYSVSGSEFSYGVFATNSNVTIERCATQANNGFYGRQSSNLDIICCSTHTGKSGIYLDHSSATVTTSTIGPDHTAWPIFAYNYSHIDVNNCLIANNPLGTGFTIQSSSSTNIVNSTFLNNLTAIYSDNTSSIMVANTSITRQISNALTIYSSPSATIEKCLIEYNGGYGIYAYNSDSNVTNSIIRENKLHGFYGSQDKGSVLQNNWFTGSTSSGSYGIYLNNSLTAPLIINNTVAKNYSGGIYRTGGSEPNIVNCIVYNNTASPANNLVGTFGHVSFSCIGVASGTYSGRYNINSDPCLAAPDSNNFHLMPASYCINKGDPNRDYTGQTDIDGEDRVVGGRIDLGGDEWFHNPIDFDGTNIVNFIDYAMFISHWGQHSSDTGWNATYDLYADGVIDTVDLMYFSDSWLWQAPWTNTGSGVMGMYAMSMMESGDPNDPNNPSDPNEGVVDPNTIFFLVESPHCSVCDTVEPNYPPGDGQPLMWLVCNNTSPDPNTDLAIYVHSEVPLSSMGVGIEISGDGVITGAMNAADCAQYGWQSGWWSDPDIDPNGTWACIYDTAGSNGAAGTVGYFMVHYNSGEVTISVYANDSYNSNQQPVTFSSDLAVIGDQNRMMRQGSSSFQLENSFNQQSVIDVNPLADWTQVLWNEDPDIRARYTEDDWQSFVDSIRSGQ